jgi:predicted metalloprotease with PDZ domain
MKKVFIAIISIAFLGSCATLNVSKNKKNLIAVAIDLNTVLDDKVKVEINPQRIKEESIVYQIPAIVPGTYSMSNYGRFVSDFKAYDYKGNEIAVEKIDDNSWKVNNAKNLDKVSYWIDDTFDSELNHGILVMGGTNIEEGKNFFLNLPGFIGYFKGKKELPYQISISHPKNLYETSSLINRNTTKTDNTKDIFVAARYDEISDNPIMYAPLNNVSFTVNGIEVNFAVYSPNNLHQAKDMEADLKKMVLAQTNFLEGFKTTNEYNILLYLFDPKVYKFSIFGALEHLSSTTVVYPESYSKKQLADGMINGMVSHEFFHIITPLSIHSEEIHSFDFNKPNMSKHLWMYEGITEYFANLFQVNQGLISEKEFISNMKNKITSSMSFDDTMSFTEMSKNILEPKYAKNYSNVYQKGALIGMSLDIILREESNGTYGVRNLMLDLSKKYGAQKAFKDAEIIDEIVKMTYPAVGTFFKNHVQGHIPIDYNTLFAKTGIKNITETVDAKYFLDKNNQPFISVNATQEIFFTKRTNSGLIALGVKSGDIIKTVNGEAISLQNARQILGKSMQWKVGDTLTFEIVRNEKTIKLEGKAIAPKTEEKSLVIEELPADNPKTKLRKAWLKG